MTAPYTILRGSLSDLEYQTNNAIKHGYTPIGGPTPGDTGRLNGNWVQAIYRAPESKVKDEGEPDGMSWRQRNGQMGRVVRPSSPPDIPSELLDKPMTGRQTLQHELLRTRSPEQLAVMSLGELNEVIEAFDHRMNFLVDYLRQLEAQPYLQYRVPKTADEARVHIADLRRVCDGLLPTIIYARISRGLAKHSDYLLVQRDILVAVRNSLPKAAADAQYPHPDQDKLDEFITMVDSALKRNDT